MLTLYNSPTSTCSQKVRLCLAEKNLEYTNHWLNYARGDYISPEYLKLNPNGVVPTLVHDDKVVRDSSVICEYLDDVFGEKRLTPDNPLARARMREWLRFIEEVPTAAIRVPSFHLSIAKQFASHDDASFEEQVASRRPLRKDFYRRMGRHGFTKEDVSASLEKLDLTLQRMEASLQHGPWLLGSDITLADLIVAPTVDRMADLGMSGMWEGPYPNVTAWYDRIKARPSFRAAFHEGARLSSVFGVDPIDVSLPLKDGSLKVSQEQSQSTSASS